MASGNSLPAGTPPDDLIDYQISFIPGVVFDQAPGGQDFGDCINEPVDSIPGDKVSATFVSGHLRNNLMLEDTFLVVEKEEEGEWVTVALDSDWSTKLTWIRTNAVLGTSEVYTYTIIYLVKMYLVFS